MQNCHSPPSPQRPPPIVTSVSIPTSYTAAASGHGGSGLRWAFLQTHLDC